MDVRPMSRGYVFLNGVIGSGESASIRVAALDDSGWEALFRTFNDQSGEMIYDTHRFQKPLPSSLAESLDATLRPKWQSYYLQHIARKWAMLKSLPGGQRQALHTDFKSSHELAPLDYTRIPSGILLAVSGVVRLYVYGWNRLVADTDDERVVTLHPGDALLFRGDLIHGGAAYDEENIRVFVYLTSTASDAIPIENATYIVAVLQDTLPDEDSAARSGKCPLHGCKFRLRDVKRVDPLSPEDRLRRRVTNMKKHIRRDHADRKNAKLKPLNEE